MSQNQGNENDYMEEDHEMANVYDDVDEEFQGRGMGGMESDDDEYDHMDNKITDTSSAQARGGKDIQGIPWERLNVTKEKYRQTRLEQYKNYESVPQSGGESEKPTKKGGMYYDFRLNTRSVKSTILHFQSVLTTHQWIVKVSYNCFRCERWENVVLYMEKETYISHDVLLTFLEDMPLHFFFLYTLPWHDLLDSEFEVTACKCISSMDVVGYAEEKSF